jgi:hypothetical protein
MNPSSGSGLLKPKYQLVARSTPLPVVVMVVPVHEPTRRIRGMVGKFSDETREVWLLNVPPSAQPFTIARLLSVLILSERESVMPIQEMPSSPPSATLLANGEMIQGRGKRLAPWAIEEIDRIAKSLAQDHGTYIEQIENALKGKTGLFSKVPADFPLSDPTGFARVGPRPPMIEAEASESDANRRSQKWYAIVADEYRRNRYLEHLPKEQLMRRIEDVMSNVHVVDSSGRIALKATNSSPHYWLSRFQEVIVEMQLRYGPYPAGFTEGLLDRNRLPGSLRKEQLQRFKAYVDQPASSRNALVKYGKRRFLDEVIAAGRIRIMPASEYNDPSLNAAVRDDELTAEVNFDSTFLGVFEGREASVAQHLHDARKIYRRRVDTNYYVYCMSTLTSNRLLIDFEADALIVIREPEVFLERLDSAVQRQVPEWRSRTGYVSYYDPLQVTPEEVDPVMGKNFRYAYQHEFRILWLPPSTVTCLEPIHVELGPLDDIAEIRYGASPE